MELEYGELLTEQYKDINSVVTEIINLQAIINLPKGTEHFLSDIHGEFDAFYHTLKNASGAIRMYIEEIFSLSLSEQEKNNLAILIYYPKERLEFVLKTLPEKQKYDFYKVTLFRFIKVLKRCTTKYTRSKVRKALPKEYAYILEELIHEDINDIDKQMYYNKIIEAIIDMNCQKQFLIAISKVINTLVVDHLHIIGDIFDKGIYPDKVMDELMRYHSLDIQWGNHDISWIGASCGSLPLICNVTRLCAKYNNLQLLEESYGVNLIPLVSYAMETFKGDDCKLFYPSNNIKDDDTDKELRLIAKVHKAITFLQFKCEAEIIKKHPEYDMENRILLDKINFITNKVKIDGIEYDLKESSFVSLDKNNPLYITSEERKILHKLQQSFLNSEKLKKHMNFLVSKGEMYTVFNNNLLFHGCIPFDENLNFKNCSFLREDLKGRALIDEIDKRVRKAYFSHQDNDDIDLMWYLWCGQDSPLFGKNKMATFEQYLVDDKDTIKEEKNIYFSNRDNEELVIKILKEFSLFDTKSKIINGHVSAKIKKHESPIKANGKLILIDSGLGRAYEKATGISGYTLIYNSAGLFLAEHQPFLSIEDVITNGQQNIYKNTIIEIYPNKILVKNTNTGRRILKKIEELQYLLDSYKK